MQNAKLTKKMFQLSKEMALLKKEGHPKTIIFLDTPDALRTQIEEIKTEREKEVKVVKSVPSAAKLMEEKTVDLRRDRIRGFLRENEALKKENAALKRTMQEGMA